jgi:hypothetical protein
MRYRAGRIPRKKVLAAGVIGFLLLSLLPALMSAEPGKKYEERRAKDEKQ